MEPLFRQILIPVDGSEASLAAVHMALRLAGLCPGCRLTALYVVDQLVLHTLARFTAGGPGSAQSELEQEGRRHLELARHDAELAGASMEIQTRDGDPFEEIVAMANALSADLIVMGHKGRRGTAGVLIGSVTERVLDYARCPVLVTRG